MYSISSFHCRKPTAIFRRYVTWKATRERRAPYPFHMTKDDRQKYTSIQNKTMAEIREIVDGKIEQKRSLGYEAEAIRLRGDWNRKIRTQKIQAFIKFYTREVLVALDEAVNSHPLLGEFIIFTLSASPLFLV